jgi:hypothetical protein
MSAEFPQLIDLDSQPGSPISGALLLSKMTKNQCYVYLEDCNVLPQDSMTEHMTSVIIRKIQIGQQAGLWSLAKTALVLR